MPRDGDHCRKRSGSDSRSQKIHGDSSRGRDFFLVYPLYLDGMDSCQGRHLSHRFPHESCKLGQKLTRSVWSAATPDGLKDLGDRPPLLGQVLFPTSLQGGWLNTYSSPGYSSTVSGQWLGCTPMGTTPLASATVLVATFPVGHGVQRKACFVSQQGGGLPGAPGTGGGSGLLFLPRPASQTSALPDGHSL